jgi:hypothetical protein
MAITTSIPLPLDLLKNKIKLTGVVSSPNSSMQLEENLEIFETTL